MLSLNIMQILCSVCGSEEINPKLGNWQMQKAYCSKRCALKANKSYFVMGTIFFLVMTISLLIVTITFVGENIYILFFTLLPGLISLISFTIFYFLWRKALCHIREDEGLTQQELQLKSSSKYKYNYSSTVMSFTRPRTSSSMDSNKSSYENNIINKEENAFITREKSNQINCFSCGNSNEIKNKTEIFCDSCGYKNIQCKLCKKFIEKDEKVGKLDPCSHIFHREHISEWIADQDYCPVCFQKIGELDLDPSNDI